METTSKRQLQRILQDKDWPVVERFLSEFLRNNFLEGSVKRDNEFETMWYVAFNEGGKFFLQKFFGQLEEEARNLIEQV